MGRKKFHQIGINHNNVRVVRKRGDGYVFEKRNSVGGKKDPL